MLEFRAAKFGYEGFSLSADWSVGAGTRLALIGPSGAGKSTLLNAIAGFTPRVEGDVLWDGQALLDSPAERPVAMLFQDHNLFPHLSIAQNVGLGIAPRLRLSVADQRRVDDALEQVGLGGKQSAKPAALSGGQQSRVALARILVMSRPIVLLDEPFAALGPAQRVEMLELVIRLTEQSGALLVMVTHDPAEALALGGAVSFVHGGVAAEPVRAEEFFKDPPAAMRDYAGRLLPDL